MITNPFPAGPPAHVRRGADSSVVAAVRNASKRSGTQFELMMASASLESGFHTDAKSSMSTATGLFQFTEQTWLATLQKHGAEHGLGTEASAIVSRNGRLTVNDPALRQQILDLRKNPVISSNLAGDHMHDLSETLSASLGRQATPGEIYMGYFLGVHGAKLMLTAHKQDTAATILPEAANANATLFYTQNGKPLTVSEFIHGVQKRLQTAMASAPGLPSNTPLTLAERSPNGDVPDAPEAGASGWGVSRPTRIESTSEQLLLASLSQAFTDGKKKDSLARDQHGGLGHAEMPASILTALQMSTS